MKLTTIAASALLAATVSFSPVTISGDANDATTDAAGVAGNTLTTPSAKGAAVYIVSPKDGDTVSGTFKVVFGLSGMGIAPAGVELEHTGHHHLLIDQQTLPEAGLPMGNPPLHFGKGQTETEITLEPGTHTLQLILGNHLHVPHDPAVVSEMITVTVSE